MSLQDRGKDYKAHTLKNIKYVHREINYNKYCDIPLKNNNRPF